MPHLNPTRYQSTIGSAKSSYSSWRKGWNSDDKSMLYLVVSSEM